MQSDNIEVDKQKRPMVINKQLFPLKVVLFCWYGATACLLPYMTIHMKDLGITVEETSIIYTILPFTQMIGSPLAGMAADKLGRYKPVLIVILVLTVIFGTAILFVPTIPQPLNQNVTHHLYCGLSTNSLEYVIPKCGHDETCTALGYDRSTFAKSLACVIECDDLNNNLTSSSVYDQLCQNNSNHGICQFLEPEGDNSFLIENITLSFQFKENMDLRSNCHYEARNIKWEDKLLDSSLCRTTFSSKPCLLSCDVKLYKEDERRFHCDDDPSDRYVTFWTYFVLRVFFSACQSTCFTLLDATTLAMVDNHEGLYGKQRFWAILSTAIFSPLTGFLIDYISEINGYPDYSPAFYFFNALVILTGMTVWMLDVTVSPAAENILKNVTQLLRLPTVSILLIVIFWLGTVWGFIESFLFWYLLDLGSPNYLLGLTLTTGAIVGLPFLYQSEWFVKKAGQVNLLILALAVYFLRCFGYSYIHSPWWCIPFEALEAFTYHLMWVAAATYSANLAPLNLLATIQGCVGGLHFGVGRGAGSFIGGMIMSGYGARVAFRVMGISSGVISVLYTVVYYSYLKKRRIYEETEKRKIQAQFCPKDESEKESNGFALSEMVKSEPLIVKTPNQDGTQRTSESSNGPPVIEDLSAV